MTEIGGMFHNTARTLAKNYKINQGALYLMGKNPEVVLAKFSTLR
jgi:hypothetical protein